MSWPDHLMMTEGPDGVARFVPLPGADEVALEKFEQLVLSQKPAEKPWEPVTDYSFEARRQAEGIHPDLICRHLLNRDEHPLVLDYGCGPDAHLVRLLTERGIDV